MDHEEYLKRVKSYIKAPTQDMEDQLAEFCNTCSYISGQYDQDESFVNLRKHLEELEGGREECNRVFYMALPPSVFITVSQHLKKNCYPKNGIARIIVGISRAYQWFKADMYRRSRSLSEKILAVRESCKEHWNRTGRKKKSSVLTIILARRWSKISSSCDLVMSSSVPPGTEITSTMYRYGIPSTHGQW